MNNNDLFKIKFDAGDFLEAARLALDFSQGKGSKSGAWMWADEAARAALKIGISLDLRGLSWPDLEKARAQLATNK